MKKIITWFGKKYALTFINDALTAIQTKTDISKWVARIERIINVLMTVLKKLEDGKIEDSEIDEIMDVSKDLIRQNS